MIDEVGENLFKSVHKVGAQRLVIDGMEGFDRAADFPERISHVYSAIAQELERLGVTTLYTTETRELFGKALEVPINGLSAATQNIIVMRHIEHRASMLRVMGILKVRDDDYDGRMRRDPDHGAGHPSPGYIRRRVARGIGRRRVERHPDEGRLAIPP